MCWLTIPVGVLPVFAERNAMIDFEVVSTGRQTTDTTEALVYFPYDSAIHWLNERSVDPRPAVGTVDRPSLGIVLPPLEKVSGLAFYVRFSPAALRRRVVIWIRLPPPS